MRWQSGYDSNFYFGSGSDHSGSSYSSIPVPIFIPFPVMVGTETGPTLVNHFAKLFPNFSLGFFVKFISHLVLSNCQFFVLIPSCTSFFFWYLLTSFGIIGKDEDEDASTLL